MNKEYYLGLYEKAMPDLTFLEKLTLTKECGFDYMEISIDETDKKLSRLDSADTVAEIKAAIEKTGVPILTMCLSGHRKYPFGAHDEAVRARSLEIMEKAIDFAVAVGIRIIQLAGYDVYYEQGDAQTVAYFEKNLRKAVEMAAKKGVMLGFETMETPFLDTVAKGMKHVDAIGSPYLGMYPDIGNLKNAAVIYGHNVADALALGQGHTFASHLKETKPGLYRDMLFGQPDGHTEYETCLRELISQGVRTFTGEFWYHDGEDYQTNVANASRFLRNKIETSF
jgi:predicted hexulose-6-phosphate isomerase